MDNVQKRGSFNNVMVAPINHLVRLDGLCQIKPQTAHLRRVNQSRGCKFVAKH
jgi:hypothetical protein